jgi:hypothetical protein
MGFVRVPGTRATILAVPAGLKSDFSGVRRRTATGKLSGIIGLRGVEVVAGGQEAREDYFQGGYGF